MLNSILDKSLYFGLQNMIFVDSDETDGTYNYYAFIDRKGLILIMRTDKTLSSVRYFTSIETYSDVWAARDDSATVYVLPSELKDLRIQP